MNIGNPKSLYSGERQVGKFLYEIAEDHLFRYKYASLYVKFSDLVLDAACGCGYGSFILSFFSKEVIGVDVSEETIDFAKQYYERENILYKPLDLEKPINFINGKFDVIVSLETIEHLKDPLPFLLYAKEILKPDGYFLCSIPDAESGIVTPFHSRNYSFDSAYDLLIRYFYIKKIETQLRERNGDNHRFFLFVCVNRKAK